jgi:hypothetical protein
VRRANAAAGKEPSIDRRRIRLATMTAHGMDARIERRVAAETGVDRQCAGDERRRDRPFGRKQSRQRESGGHLRAVEQRQPFLRPQCRRLQSGARERIASAHRSALDPGLAFADQYRGKVRQRREIARRTHRSLRRNAGNDAGVRHGEKRFDDAPPDSRMAARERCDLERDDQAHDRVVEQRPRAGRMRQHQRALQRGKPCIVDPRAREQAETGVDAVDDPMLATAA